jgi:ribonuclease HII
MTNDLATRFSDDPEITEIGIDEVGRGPLFGRVYVAGAILPKLGEGGFNHALMKDSKRFTSTKRLDDAYNHIVEHCIDREVCYEDEDVIDSINILQATQKAMHKCAQILIERNNLKPDKTILLIDGNYFNPYTQFDKNTGQWLCYDNVCIKGGDNLYTNIAAASIMAKVERDRYIADLCTKYPELDEKYSIASNKGYGAKKHLDGIRSHGITKWHRKTFGICKEF